VLSRSVPSLPQSLDRASKPGDEADLGIVYTRVAQLPVNKNNIPIISPAGGNELPLQLSLFL